VWHAHESVDIAARPETVWAVVADIDGHTRLAGSGEVKAIRFDGPVEPGATFEGDIATGEVGSFVVLTVERAGERVLLRLRVDPPVGGVGEQLVRRLVAGSSNAVAPGAGRRLRGHHRAATDLSALRRRADSVIDVRPNARSALASERIKRTNNSAALAAGAQGDAG